MTKTNTMYKNESQRDKSTLSKLETPKHSTESKSTQATSFKEFENLNDDNNNNSDFKIENSIYNLEDNNQNELVSNSFAEEWQLLDSSEVLLARTDMEKDKLLSSNTMGSKNQEEEDSITSQDIREINSSRYKRTLKIVGHSKNCNIYPELIETNPLENDYNNKYLVHLCTAIYSLVPIASMFACLALFYILVFTRYYYVTIIYATWIIYNKQRCNKGGSRIDFVYKSSFYKYLANYFNMKIRYPSNFELNIGEKNYLINYHPHGISAFGSVCTFATNGMNIDKLFPGIKSRFLVHESSFCMPVMREVFSSRGDCSVNSSSIDYILSGKCGTGNLCSIVVGGLNEADLSDAETLKVVVAERKGFVKKALVHGTDLIPCIAFGENSVFNKVNFVEGSFMDRLQDRWYKLLKFKHPIYYGCSAFSDKLYGLMPFKRQITVSLGNPINVDKVVNPSQEQINSLHDKYICELQKLYNSNKDLCSKYDTTLVIL